MSEKKITQAIINKLEHAYRTDPRPLIDICKELGVNYSTYPRLKSEHFPEVERCPGVKNYKRNKLIEDMGLTKKDVLTIKCKYIKTQIPIDVIREEFGLTLSNFNCLHKYFFPEWKRVGRNGCKKAVKDESLVYCSDDEILEATGKISRLNSTDMRWLEQHWQWKDAEGIRRKAAMRHTVAICNSGRRFG